MTACRVLLYVQHLLGIGHLVRASRIAGALSDAGFEVAVVMGGVPVSGFPDREIRVIALPPLKAAPGFSGLLDAESRVVSEKAKEHRRDLLLSAVNEFRPQVVITEAFPFGRRQMRFELMPMIELAHRMQPKPLIASSIRDILQEKVKPARSEETVRIVQDYFDLVLVHGDPAFSRIEDTFPLVSRFSEKVVYTGLVARSQPAAAGEHFDIVVSAGGGAAGARLIAESINAAKLLPENLRWCVITGPNLPAKSTISSPPSNLGVFAFRPDFPALLAGARLSISQAGYNTVCDMLQANCRSVLVPFAEGGETEQTMRANRLETLGLAKVLPEHSLSPASLVQAITQALQAKRPKGSSVDLRGAQNTAEVLLERLGQPMDRNHTAPAES
ncbi:MAG: glycosyltransferase family protein [Aestuariivirgaceae bacterium]